MIQCKDCRNYCVSHNEIGTYTKCSRNFIPSPYYFDFCSRAEPKEVPEDKIADVKMDDETRQLIEDVIRQKNEEISRLKSRLDFATRLRFGGRNAKEE